jgi:hypothetical protein
MKGSCESVRGEDEVATETAEEYGDENKGRRVLVLVDNSRLEVS